MEEKSNIKEIQSRWHGSRKAYILGFILSFLLTLLSFAIISEHLFEKKLSYYVITSLAIVQLFVQLILFLHLGQETRPKWNLAVFFLMAVILLIVVLGSLWIMYDLNERVMRMEM